ncbi:MAG: imidazole glycerol-phosphate synthase subunit HisF [Sphingomonadales bacterium]|jgi:cyclase|nr:imidazole glycerol-phosphate synthase subunit HisF [Sphingomonadales bacterium]
MIARRPRLIPVLLVDRDRRLVKTVGFGERTYVGDPFNVIRLFNEKEVDEICVLDIDATVDGRAPDLGFVGELASECFMPLSYGGGLASLEPCQALATAGVEKFVIGSATGDRHLIGRMAAVFGQQAVVGCVDYRGAGAAAIACTRSGQSSLGLDPLDHARFLVEAGVGEIILQSIDRDGRRAGMDLEQIARMSPTLPVPLVALGGAGETGHLLAALDAGASAAASGSAFSFIGRLRAVLITYPGPAELAAL